MMVYTMESNTINLAPEKDEMSVDEIRRYIDRIHYQKCPVCNQHHHAILVHLRDMHPAEYKIYIMTKQRINSISAIEERLLAILKDGPHTRDQLVKKMDVPRTTIYDGLRRLIMHNEVKKFPLFATERSRGRPQVLFSLLDGKE